MRPPVASRVSRIVRSHRLTFGRYEGKTLRDIHKLGDISYLIWLTGYELRGTCRANNYSRKIYKLRRRRPVTISCAQSYMRSKCWCCGGPLYSIGWARKNGKNHPDWNSRLFHKKCYKELTGRILEEDYEMGDNV